jgi:DNA-binding NtrC family response regulator
MEAVLTRGTPPANWRIVETLTHKHQILVVEDDEGLLAMLKSAFTCSDIEVHTASSVAAGIEAVDRLPISLVMLDWTFPCPSAIPRGSWDPFLGKPVLEACLAKDPLLPVVVMSGYSMIDVAESALTSGAASFLAKPLKLSAADSHVRRLLHRFELAKTRFHATSPGDVRPLKDIERDYVKSVVQLFGGNQRKAAEGLGLTRQTVAKIIKAGGVGGAESQISNENDEPAIEL